MKKRLLIASMATISILLAACGSNGTKETSSNDNSGTVENHYFVDGKELTEDEYNQYLSKQEESNKELTEGEKVVVYTIQQLQDALKNPHSLEIYSIHYKRQYSDNTGDYYIKIEYSANNDLGGRVEDTLYYKFDIDVFSDDSEKALRAKMFGCEEVAFNEYDTGRRADYEETEIDIDRILNNIDITIIE